MANDCKPVFAAAYDAAHAKRPATTTGKIAYDTTVAGNERHIRRMKNNEKTIYKQQTMKIKNKIVLVLTAIKRMKPYTGELGYDGPLYDGLLAMTDDMLGPSPMHINYVYFTMHRTDSV